MLYAVLLMMAILAAIAPVRADGPLVIGVAGPMSGRFADQGELMRAAVALAVADANAAGGVLGRRLTLTVEDDRCSSDQAVDSARRLVAADSRLVVGHYCAGASLAASTVYASAGVIQINPASRSPRVSAERAGLTAFRLAGRDDRQGEVAGRYLGERYAGRRIAILHDRTVFGRRLAEEVRDQLQRAGTPAALFSHIIAGEKDYSSTIRQIKEIHADVVYFGGYPTEAALILRQLRSDGLSSALFGADVLASAEFWTLAGRAGEGTLLTLASDFDGHPAAAGIARRLREQSVGATAHALQSYAAVQVWVQAATRAGDVAARAVAAFLAQQTFKTIIGDVGFDASGDATIPSFTVRMWRDGRVEYAD